jgi:hypothetical protein
MSRAAATAINVGRKYRQKDIIFLSLIIRTPFFFRANEIHRGPWCVKCVWGLAHHEAINHGLCRSAFFFLALFDREVREGLGPCGGRAKSLITE